MLKKAMIGIAGVYLLANIGKYDVNSALFLIMIYLVYRNIGKVNRVVRNMIFLVVTLYTLKILLQ